MANAVSSEFNIRSIFVSVSVALRKVCGDMAAVAASLSPTRPGIVTVG